MEKDELEVIEIIVCNPRDRLSVAKRIDQALSQTPEHGAIKVKSLTEVIAYRDWCVKKRKSDPNFRQRIEKLNGGGWLLFKNINAAEAYYDNLTRE